MHTIGLSLNLIPKGETKMAVRIGKCDIPNLSDIVESTFDNVMNSDFIYGNNYEFEPVETDFDFDDDFSDEEIE